MFKNTLSSTNRSKSFSKQHSLVCFPNINEATASIDPENEHLIQAAISELTKGKTLITIAHRLATIENADQILVVDEGRIVQKGTHRELIGQEGKYLDFVRAREQTEGWQIQ